MPESPAALPPCLFQTFSEPKVWQNPAPRSRIDTTAIKVDDTYYRVTKDEAGNAGSDIFSEKMSDPAFPASFFVTR